MKQPETMDGLAKAVAKMKSDKVAEREAIATQHADLAKQLAEIDSEIDRLAMIEGAANGTVQLAPSPPPKAQAATNRAPRGSVQTDIARLLEGKQEGLSRADFITTMEATGDKKREASISNALAAMKKADKLAYKDGKYALPTGNSLI